MHFNVPVQDREAGTLLSASHMYVEQGAALKKTTSKPVLSLFVTLLRFAPMTEWDWASASG